MDNETLGAAVALAKSIPGTAANAAIAAKNDAVMARDAAVEAKDQAEQAAVDAAAAAYGYRDDNYFFLIVRALSSVA